MRKIYFIIAISILLMHDIACAVDFKIKGQWQFAISSGEVNLVQKKDGKNADAKDQFHARQRIRLQMDAAVSEFLSGTLFFEIGNQMWGSYGSGGALGADGNVVKLRQAYLDAMLPHTDIKLRAGILNLSLPKKAGGGLVMDTLDVAGIAASHQFNEALSATAFWVRPFNDNYTENGSACYLDNMDLFGLVLPIRMKDIEVSPWVMYGIRGKNTFPVDSNGKAKKIWNDGMPNYTLSSHPFSGTDLVGDTDKLYGNMFWAGLATSIRTFDPWNIELDFNYGYVEEMGRYSTTVRGSSTERASTRREGWLAKGLIEYKTDWGIPGIFGWYASGDDGTLKNGSERMPSIAPWAKFTSFMGSANFYPTGFNDIGTNYQGTWGLGCQVRDISFVDDLTHVFRVAYWRGTNSTSMAKYASSRDSWNYGVDQIPNKAGIYLTIEDSLIEFNLDSYYQMYENLKIGLELAYIINNMSHDVWQDSDKTYFSNASMAKQDVWRVTLYFGYSF